MSDRHFISAHLLVRWLERFEGVKVGVFRAAMERMNAPCKQDIDLITFIEEYSCIDVDRVRKALIPMVRKAAIAGAKTIKYQGMCIPIGMGAITVYPNRRRKRLKAGK